MNKKLRHAALLSTLVLLVGFMALNLLAQRHAHAMLHYAPPNGARTEKPETLTPLAKFRVLLSGVHLPRPIDDRPPSVLAPNAQALTIPSSENITLSGWYAPHNASSPLVIFFPGYSTEKNRLLLEARHIHAMGASVLLMDFRGSGGSSESYTTLGMLEADDVAATVRYARNHLAPPPTALLLYGQSMGSAAILRSIHTHAITPDAVILESVFDTMLNTIRNRFHAMGIPSFPSAELLTFWGGASFGFNGFTHRPIDYARSLTCPALFLHGADDPRATLADARRVFDAAPGPKQFVTFENVGHDSYAARYLEQWQTTLRDFLQPFLSPPSPTITYNYK